MEKTIMGIEECGVGYRYANVTGYGCGYGCGDGYGNGYGYGYGYDRGDGYGYGDMIIYLSEPNHWIAYHFIKIKDNKLLLKNGKKKNLDEILFEKDIKLCYYGLHSSLSEENAKKYKPSGSILTKVKIWGKINIGEDKIVSQYRQIIKIYDKEQ